MSNSKNIAVIDLGSNLTKLVIAKGALPLQVNHRSIYNTKTLKNAPKGEFDEASIALIERDIEAILEVIKDYQCQTVLGIATSAFRTRKNGQQVIDHINSKFQTSIQIISGNQEAQFVFDGAMASVSSTRKPVLVMDIGGGSTEFIIGNENGVLWKHSFELGSTAITRWTNLKNPLTTENLQVLQAELSKVLIPLLEAINHHNPISFIGTTGAFESFAQIISFQNGNSESVDSGFEFNPPQLEGVLNTLIASTVESRKVMKGVHPLRYDTIHLAAVIFQYLFKNTKFESYMLSLGDVKEGLIVDFLKSNYANH